MEIILMLKPKEQNFQYHFGKNSYQYGVDFEKRQPSLQIWAFLGVELNEQLSDQRWQDQLF